jgi:hypothetical protein
MRRGDLVRGLCIRWKDEDLLGIILSTVNDTAHVAWANGCETHCFLKELSPLLISASTAAMNFAEALDGKFAAPEPRDGPALRKSAAAGSVYGIDTMLQASGFRTTGCVNETDIYFYRGIEVARLRKLRPVQVLLLEPTAALDLREFSRRLLALRRALDWDLAQQSHLIA